MAGARQEREVGGIAVGVGHAGGARYGSSQVDGRTELMKALAEANGAPVNFCPFNCLDEDLDEQGYCFHLIGFSPNGKKLERNVLGPDGRLRTIAPIQRVNGKPRFVFDAVDRKKHVLVPVTKGGTFRVYEDVVRPADYPAPESDELTAEELAELEDDEDDEDGDSEDAE